MADTPNSPSAIPDNPELQRALENIYQRVEVLRVGKISAELRQKMIELIGKRKLDQIVTPPTMIRASKLNASQIADIYRTMAEVRAGLAKFIPDDQNRQLQTMAGDMTIGDLVRDPTSREAKLLSWLYAKSVDANPGAMIEYSKIFDIVTRDEVQRAENLLKVQSLMKKIQGEKKNLGLGNAGTINTATTPPTVTGGTPGKLLDTQTQLAAARYEAEQSLRKQTTNVRTRTPRGTRTSVTDTEVKNPEFYTDRLKKLEEQYAALQSHRTGLVDDLRELNQAVVPLLAPGTATFTDAQIEGFASDVASLRGNALFTGNDVDIGDGDHSIQSYVDDTGLEDKVSGMKERLKFSGNGGLPPARLALRELLKLDFSGDLYGMSKDDEKKFYDQLQTTLLSGQSVIGNTGKSKDGASKEAGEGDETSTTRRGRLWKLTKGAVVSTKDITKKVAKGAYNFFLVSKEWK